MVDKGAHFYRTDFQVHTPRDGTWAGDRPTSDDDRKQFAVELVIECRRRDLHAIAITDHHDFAFFPYVREAALAEQRSDGSPVQPEERLVVFPGLELTLGVPCQALLLLDADFPVDQLGLVLTALAIDEIDKDAPSLPPVQRLEHLDTLAKIHEELDRREWLRHRYILLPNVTDGGYGTLMRKHMHGKYKEMPCVGGYLDGTVQTKVGDGNRRIFAGLEPAWGNKRIALFQTSDSRSSTFADLGKNSTWVKWATPTAEALRQACLAEESRITQDRPCLPTTYVTRISVSNSRFMGPIELELNPQYNAIIGGRGTGKSSCLEYLRWALCDQPAGMAPDDELSDQSARRQRLISGTLEAFDAHVDVHFVLNGIAHIVRRRAASGAASLKVGEEDFRDVTAEEVQSLLPIHAYSQKQLSGVSVRLDELTRFVTSPIRGVLSDIDARTQDLAARTRRNYANLRRQRDLIAAIHRDELTASSLTQQATNLRESLAAVSPDDRAALDAKTSYDTGDQITAALDRRIEQLKAGVTRFHDAVRAVRDGLGEVPDENLPSAEALRSADNAVRTLTDALIRSAEDAQATLDAELEGTAPYGIALDIWRRDRASFEERYQGAKERSSAQQSQLAQLTELEQRARSMHEGLETQREELKQLGDPLDEHVRLRSEWVAVRTERSDALRNQCDALTEQSGGLIRATIRAGAGVERLRESFTAAIRGSSVRTERVTAFFSELATREDPATAWEGALADLDPTAADESGTLRPLSTVTSMGLTHADAQRIVSKLTPESWLGLALTPVEDHPSFEFQTKPGEYIAFADASAGQQATALLRVLLNQSGPPLIIDQPEDDLDSEIVLQVVEQIWTAKTQRQLIFTSHNPNLVVNGDAELVVCCSTRTAGDHSGGRIKREGAIDVPEVRDEITTIMEGGERAFRLRKEKYGF